MKKFYAVLFGAFLSAICFAVAPSTKLTLNVTPGGLAELISAEDRSVVTELVLSGSVDARDFTTMRDSLPVLENVNMSAISIVSYKGPLGPGGDTYYDADHIPHRSFYLKSSIHTYIAPVSLKSIGNNAFRGSSLGGSFDVPEGVTSIGSYVFSGCSNLTEVIIHDNVTEIGGYAFQDCSGLSSINLPDVLTSIGSSAFLGCSNLLAVDIPVSVVELGSSAFRDCNRLASVKLSASITVLEDNVFRGDSALNGKLILPATLTSVQKSVFEKCSGIDTILVPNTVKSIGELAFANCDDLSYVVLPDTMEYISAKIFLNDSALMAVDMPNALDSISFDAFRNCVSIKKMVIPDVDYIGENAFRSCSGLDSIFALGRTPVDLVSSPNVFHFVDKEACRLFVPYKSLEAYQTANQWEDFFAVTEEAISFNVDSLSASGDGIDVDSLALESGLTWGVNAGSDWISAFPDAGKKDDILHFTLEENTDTVSRETIITFNIYNLYTELLTLKQKANPVINWEMPDSLVIGTVISDTLFNASSNVAGVFTYSPELGTVVEAGVEQVITLTFTPDDTVNFSTISTESGVKISKMDPEVEVVFPDTIIGGTVMAEDLFTIDTELAGTVTYEPALGTTLEVGEELTIKVTFTPEDTDNYRTVTYQTVLGVGKKDPVVEVSFPDVIGGGTILTEDLFTIDSDIEGTLSFEPELGTVFEEGEGQTVEVTFTPEDADNYNVVTKTVTVNVEAASVSTDETSLAFGGNGEVDNSLIISANTNWTINIDVEWLSANKESGYAADTVVFTALANTTGAERTATVTFSAEGMEDVVITVSQEPEDHSAVADDSSDQLTLYPNPVVDRLSIGGFDGIAEVAIFDLTGKMVAKYSTAVNQSKDVSYLNKGIYFVEVNTAQGKSIIKLIKK